MKVTIYNDFHTPVEDKDFLAVIEQIKSNDFEEKIKSIRYAYHQGNESLGDSLKRELPAFTPSATFINGRTLDALTSYNQLAHVDLDDIPVTELNNLLDVVNNSDFTFASFISPSGMGIKIFVRINSNQEDHAQMIVQLMQYYGQLTGYVPDQKCKDITRLCFLSWDPEAFVNNNSEIFSPFIEFKHESKNTKQIVSKDIDYCIQFTEKISTYEKGNRNSHIYLVARNGNRFGIDKQTVLDYCLNSFDLNHREIIAAVESAYKHNTNEFAKFASIATLANDKTNTTTEEKDWSKDLLYTTPKIPPSVYDNLPSLLKRGADAFEIHREKDVFLTTALTILSGCMPNVEGLYSQRKVYPNLFCFVLAPPASGKGSMQSSKELADVYHNFTLKQSLELKKDYDRQMRLLKNKRSATNKNKEENDDGEIPEEPPFKVVFIPANTSSAQLYVHLKSNDEQGIICETEADTLGAVFKNEWGSYSDLLRKGFHHEKVSLSRKTNKEFIDINHPRLSVALTGTPSQIFNIIPSAEDGLFSRFIFYAFRSDAGWISPAPDPNRVNLTDHFKALSNEVFEMVQFLENQPTSIELTLEQWEKLNDAFTEHLHEIIELAGEEATSIVKRMGLVLYRICMIFSTLRKIENGDCSETIVCEDIDFDSASTLVNIYIQHSILMFANLPNKNAHHTINTSPKKQKFFEALPDTFQRKEAIEIGESLGLKSRTIDTCLRNWVDEVLEKEDTGCYRKL